MHNWTKLVIIAVALSIGACDDTGATKADKTAAPKTADKKPAKTAAPKQADKKPAKTAAPKQAGPAHINLDEKGRGLRGFDPVAYKTDNKPVEGKAEFMHEWNDAKWYFASEENKKQFVAEPEKYAPQNGGYCTFGVVLSKKFDGDPNIWHVKDDSLYVFLNAEVKDKFLQDETGNLEKVSTNWPAIKDKTPAELGK